jgi:hypothetical protein
MANFIKRAQTVQEVGLKDNSSITRVDMYVQQLNSKNSSKVMELSRGDFEKNTVEDNAAFFTSEDTNPLISGLKALDRASMVIVGKRACSTFAFSDDMVCSTPYFIKKADLSEAKDIILRNLSMREPVLAGVPKKRPLAIAFDELAMRITKDVRSGNSVFDKYIDEVIMKGTEAMKEWIYNG